LGAKRLNRCALLFLASLALAACGVRFGDEFEGTELFKTAWLTQDIDGKAEPCAREGATWVCRANTRLSVNVGVTNGYPVPVRVACYYEDPEALTEDDEDLAFVERATMVGGSSCRRAKARGPTTSRRTRRTTRRSARR
jgi:hypothetical protein